jgi:proteasome lid subunit RPN8/RPN11
MTIARVRVPLQLLETTVRELSRHRLNPTERVALWLGRRQAGHICVHEMYVPAYEAESDYFYIAPGPMRQLMRHLRGAGLMIAAQLHTHPEEAFHSAADDKWAIVRHVGALSLVLPDFGVRTTPDAFFETAKVFRLDRMNRWEEVAMGGIHAYVEIIK